MMDTNADDAINTCCVALLDLRLRDDLSETENALIYAAWQILADAHIRALRRRRPELAPSEAA
jgi:hypothetical protein